MIVLKIGGSLFDSARELLKRVAEEERDVLVVPGGGAFADKVRDIYGTANPCRTTPPTGWRCLPWTSTATFYRTAPASRSPMTINGKGTRIALAYEILRKDDALPHSWDVTSDTVAAWMAAVEAGS